ncbi:hypothetical protein [Sphingobium sp. Sx8-8]|uniref:hypothetical protein n=1 Tax=Sphingobium sp. Sx8-8 TaxID=2933617 RepID=UPI001F57770D|nr:hypothetical protein [Sphingobium sp. Sx8-8]
MTFKSILTGSVMIGLLMAPLTAQAGTRTQASTMPIRPAIAEAAFSDFGARKSVTVRKENGIQTGSLILVGLLGAGVGAATYAIVDDSNKSRGAN